MKAGYKTGQGRPYALLSSGKTGHVAVPHSRKDIRIGTLRSIYSQAG
ncbi:type II toxin-antitoxin system HicA family toxin [Cardiobacterium valvarum]